MLKLAKTIIVRTQPLQQKGAVLGMSVLLVHSYTQQETQENTKQFKIIMPRKK